jgi:hypothetical protein
MQKKIINFILTILVLVYILFEELIWDRFATPIIRYISSLKILKKLDHFLKRVDSRVILAIFLVIFVLVESLGIYAGALFLSGKAIKGALIYAFKIPIAAFTFWLFDVTKDKLLEFRWFKNSYYFIVGLIDKIKHSTIYNNIKKRSTKIKTYIKKNFLQDKTTIKERVVKIYKRLKMIVRM